MSIQLTATGTEGTWQVLEDGAQVGTWERTEVGALLHDTAGECVAVVSAVGDGTAIVAGCGAQHGRWSDLAHKILAGRCEISERDPMQRKCDDCGAAPGQECSWSCSSNWD